jgi:hypothetical protein
MAEETEYKGFRISLRLQGDGWTATIERRDSPSLHDPTVSVDIPPQGTAIDAMKLALDLIDSASVS